MNEANYRVVLEENNSEAPENIGLMQIFTYKLHNNIKHIYQFLQIVFFFFFVESKQFPFCQSNFNLPIL